MHVAPDESSAVLAPGQAWILHAGEALAIMATLPSGCMDAVITDAPYSSGGAFRGDRAGGVNAKYERTGLKLPRLPFAGDNKDQRSWTSWCTQWLSECRRLAKPGAPLCTFADWRQVPAMTDAVQWADWVWRGIAVWDKGEGARSPCTGRPRHQAEFVVWGSNGPLPSNRGVPILPGVKKQSVLQKNKHHLCGKPPEVMDWLVTICPEGGIVFDPFAGSGTTGVAALGRGLRFVGIEREPEYIEVARRRLILASRSPS